MQLIVTIFILFIMYFCIAMDLSNLNRIGDRIRVCRVEKKLSQENVANDLGISVTAYSRIERGQTNVSIKRLEQIASCLQIPLARLMYSSGDIYQQSSAGNSFTSGNIGYAAYDINTQSLLSNLQAEVSRLNKIIEEKNDIIVLLKDLIANKK